MNHWKKIDSAPLNPEGESYGPWIMGYYQYDGGIYQIRWECHGDKRGWYTRAKTSLFTHHVTHWVPSMDYPI